MTALYALTSQYREAADKLSELDLDEDTIRDTLESMSGPVQEKIIAVAMIARNKEADADAIEKAQAEMEKRKRALRSQADGMKQYAMNSMLATDQTKIECPYFRLTVRDNPPAVDVYELGIVPAQYMVQAPPPPPALDKRAIGEALKAGIDVPGCQLRKGKRLEIK